MKSEQKRTILISDTDAAGVVFFGRYPVLFHDAYELMLSERGIALLDQAKDTGIMIPVTHLNVEYRRPLKAGDLVRITVETELVDEDCLKVFGSIWKQTERGEKETTRYEALHASVSLETGRKTPFPAFWKQLFSG